MQNNYVKPKINEKGVIDIKGGRHPVVEKMMNNDMFIANVKGVYADEAYMDEKGKFELVKAKPIVYSHGQYYGLGCYIGKFGYSVQKKPAKVKKAIAHKAKPKSKKA